MADGGLSLVHQPLEDDEEMYQGGSESSYGRTAENQLRSIRVDTTRTIVLFSFLKADDVYGTERIERKSNHAHKESVVQAFGDLCLTLAGLLAAACGDPEPSPEPDSSWQVSWRSSFRPCFSKLGESVVDLGMEHWYTSTDDLLTQRPSPEQITSVAEKYSDLLWGYPYVTGVALGDYMDTTFAVNRTLGFGITVRVSKYVDNRTLPEERRLPVCLDGVPVRIIKQGPIKIIKE